MTTNDNTSKRTQTKPRTEAMKTSAKKLGPPTTTAGTHHGTTSTTTVANRLLWSFLLQTSSRERNANCMPIRALIRIEAQVCNTGNS